MNLHYNNDYTNLMRRNREKSLITTKFIFDIIILLVCPLPYYDYTIYISEYIAGSPVAVQAPYLVSDFIIGKLLHSPNSVHVLEIDYSCEVYLQPH